MTPTGTAEKLKRHCQALYELLQSVLDAGLASKEDDDMAFMAITFVAKQSEHLGSLGVLIVNERYFDAGLVARTMIEGAALLAWATDAPKERAGNWRAYAVVFDLQWIRQEQAEGKDVPADQEALVLEALKTLGKPFLKTGRGHADLGDPNAYKRRWHVDENGKVITVTEILDRLGSPTLVDIYAELSGWVHWNARGLGPALSRTKGRVRIDFGSPEYGNLAMVAGFVSALQSLHILDEKLHLGRGAEIQAIRDAFLADLGSGKAA